MSWGSPLIAAMITVAARLSYRRSPAGKGIA
jgi:hypothetical protein